jgi:hypothetical protein
MAFAALIEKHFTKLTVSIWLITSLLMIVLLRQQIAGWAMGDPDDQLRMVEVRDWLAGQNWFDVSQHRMNVPDHGPMHWSRLVDIPLALVMLIFRPFFGIAGAELAAAVIVPMLTYGAVLYLIANITRQLFGKGAALLATATLWTSLQVMQQLVPMRIDHHGWQIVLFLGCVLALCRSSQTLNSGALIGGALALWLNISIEGLPFAAVILGLLGLRWIWPDDKDARNLGRVFALACISFAGSSALLFIVTHNLTEMAVYCDTVSPPHLWAFAAVAGVISAGVATSEKTGIASGLLFRGTTALVAGIAGILIIRAAAPQCLSDAFADLDPVVRQYWFDRGLEGLPIWAQLPASIHLATGGILAGLIATVYWNFASGTANRRLKFEYLILLIANVLIGLTVFRTVVYALCLSLIIAAGMAVMIFKRAEAGTGLGSRMGWRIAATMLLLPGTVASSIGNAIPTASASSQNAKADADMETLYAKIRQCQKSKTTMALRALPVAQLMAPLDQSPAILQFTQHEVVATGHHRNQVAMRDVINAFITPPEQARAIFAKRKIDYLVACEASFELMIYEDDAPNGLWAQLKKGNRPDWLQPAIKIGGNSVWKVDLTAKGHSK